MRGLVSLWGQETKEKSSFPVEKQKIGMVWICCVCVGGGASGRKDTRPGSQRMERPGGRQSLAHAGTAKRPGVWRVVTQGDELQGQSERDHGHPGSKPPDNDMTINCATKPSSESTLPPQMSVTPGD